MIVANTNGENNYIFTIYQDNIYYALNSGNLYRIKTDGTNKTKIAELSSYARELTVSGIWIYYKAENCLYKMKTDGTSITKLLDDYSEDPYSVEDEWLYYSGRNDNGDFVDTYRMKIDGTEKTKLSDGLFFTVEGDWLYFEKDGWLYKANLDGTDAIQVFDTDTKDDLASLFIHGEYIYYNYYKLFDVTSTYRVNIDGSNKITIE